jgi:ABC-type polysaccharide/polyol phosphate export permease
VWPLIVLTSTKKQMSNEGVTAEEATIGGSLKGLAIAGLTDLIGGSYYWRVWHLIGFRELRHRYARSKFGQLWLTLSTGAMIGVLAAVWALLWKQPVHELIPFLGISMITWNYLSQILMDCTTIFVGQANLYRNQKMNFSVSIYSVIYKNTIMLAHNLIIIVILMVAFDVPINWYLLQVVPALGLTWIAFLCFGYLIAMMCVRYRDIIQVINTWLTVLFYVTPIMWKPDFLPRQYHWIIDFNPLAQFLEILRNPLLGQPISVHSWLSTTMFAFGGGLIAVCLIGRYRHRIIFWM